MAEGFDLDRRQFVKVAATAAWATPLILTLGATPARAQLPSPGQCVGSTQRPNGCPCSTSAECASGCCCDIGAGTSACAGAPGCAILGNCLA